MQICLSSWKIVEQHVCVLNLSYCSVSESKEIFSCMFRSTVKLKQWRKIGVEMMRRRNVIKVIGLINFYCLWEARLGKFNGFPNGVNRTESTTEYCVFSTLTDRRFFSKTKSILLTYSSFFFHSSMLISFDVCKGKFWVIFSSVCKAFPSFKVGGKSFWAVSAHWTLK